MTTTEEKIKGALAKKDLGNEAFKNGDNKQALLQYHHAVLALSGLDHQGVGVPMLSAAKSESASVSEEQKSVIKINLAVIYSNMGAVHLKNGNYSRAIEVCNSALKNDPDNVKAKFRRAQAKSADGNIAGAEADLLSLGESVPGVKAELAKLKAKSKVADAKQRKEMGGFLSRGRILTDEDGETVKSDSTQGKSANKEEPKIRELNDDEE